MSERQNLRGVDSVAEPLELVHDYCYAPCRADAVNAVESEASAENTMKSKKGESEVNQMKIMTVNNHRAKDVLK